MSDMGDKKNSKKHENVRYVKRAENVENVENDENSENEDDEYDEDEENEYCLANGKNEWNNNFQSFSFYHGKGYKFKIGLEPKRTSVWIELSTKEKEDPIWKESVLSNPNVIGTKYKCIVTYDHLGYFIGYDDCDKERTKGISLLVHLEGLYYLLVEGAIILFEALDEIIEFKSPMNTSRRGPAAYPYGIDAKNRIYTYTTYSTATPKEIRKFNHKSISEVPYYLEMEKKQGHKFDNLVQFIRSFENSYQIHKAHDDCFNSQKEENQENTNAVIDTDSEIIKQKLLNAFTELEKKENWKKQKISKGHIIRDNGEVLHDFCCEFPQIYSEKSSLEKNSLRKFLSLKKQLPLKGCDLSDKFFKNHKRRQKSFAIKINN